MSKNSEVAVVVSIEDRIAALIGEREELSMYALANVMSDVLGVRVREQMMYNYRAKKLVRTNSSGKIDRADAIAFIAKRVRKNESTSAE